MLRASAITPLTVASTAVADRMVMMDINTTMTSSVSLPPPKLNVDRSSKRLWLSLPLLTIGVVVSLCIVVSALVPVRLWEVAPGSVQQVGSRLSFDAKAREVASIYPTQNSINFVTALGSKLSLLDALVGTVDRDVDVQTYEDRFGSESPSVQRQIGAQSMTTSKEIAEYVALDLLGYPVSFSYGDIVIQELVCADNPAPRSACNVLNVGDVIVALDGKSTPTLEQLVDAMVGKKSGDEVTVTVIPHGGGNQSSRRVELMTSPDDPNRTIIGFIPLDTRTVQLPFQVEIDTDSIGGPSAGLAFTLALLDELTPGDLFGGHKVVATGTVSEDGSVGAIGALPQKSAAVRMSGADVFLVPASQSDQDLIEARRVLGKNVRIVTVASVEEALQVLRDLGGSGLENATIDL